MVYGNKSNLFLTNFVQFKGCFEVNQTFYQIKHKKSPKITLMSLTDVVVS